MADTLGHHFNSLIPGIGTNRTMPDWPPDVFALAASALSSSGAYVRCFADRSHRDWETQPGMLRKLGKGWRDAFNRAESPPKRIQGAWEVVSRAWDLPIADIATQSRVRKSLFLLFAAADETAQGVGYNPEGAADLYHEYCQTSLAGLGAAGASPLGRDPDSNLCQEVLPSCARVLPKMHAPQRGLTLRSLSRNLALCPTLSITSSWLYAIEPFGPELQSPSRKRPRNCNLLLIPWPFQIQTGRFRACPEPPTGPPGQYAGHRFFSYDPGRREDDEGVVQQLREIVDSASRHDQVDGVVLPELALSATQFERLAEHTRKKNAFLVSGVGIDSESKPGSRRSPGRNEVWSDFPLQTLRIGRQKHHRWCVDRGQIQQYGLGGSLHTQSLWWEWIAIEQRRMHFVSIAPRFTMCSLVCEDLAQQDPLSNLIRSVGPNLVIALLMDGPQLSGRWPARYASVLADDPGSSVLTLTSLGMAELSRPRGASPSRRVALWKDALDGAPIEIELPQGAQAICLHLTLELRDEYTADGRVGEACYPVLGGIHFVRIKS